MRVCVCVQVSNDDVSVRSISRVIRKNTVTLHAPSKHRPFISPLLFFSPSSAPACCFYLLSLFLRSKISCVRSGAPFQTVFNGNSVKLRTNYDHTFVLVGFEIKSMLRIKNMYNLLIYLILKKRGF